MATPPLPSLVGDGMGWDGIVTRAPPFAGPGILIK